MRTATVREQGGASALSVLAGMIALVAIITLLLRLGPHYIDWQTMKTIFSDLPVSQVNTMSKKEIQDSLKKRFRVNNLRAFDLKEIIIIDRQKTGTTISVEYERRENIVANLDAVLTFSEQYQFQ